MISPLRKMLRSGRRKVDDVDERDNVNDDGDQEGVTMEVSLKAL